VSVPGLTDAWAGRRRPWLLAAIAALLVAIYLAGWSAYSTNGLVAYSRYEQQPPGAGVFFHGSDLRVLAITRTAVLAGRGPDDGEGVDAAANLTWVVVDIEVTRRSVDDGFVCSFELLGPDRRRWAAATSPASGRQLSTFCDDDDMRTGRPYRFQAIYSVPTRFENDLYGVVPTTAEEPIPVLRPPV
jgi:hypothetical protein